MKKIIKTECDFEFNTWKFDLEKTIHEIEKAINLMINNDTEIYLIKINGVTIKLPKKITKSEYSNSHNIYISCNELYINCDQYKIKIKLQDICELSFEAN